VIAISQQNAIEIVAHWLTGYRFIMQNFPSFSNLNCKQEKLRHVITHTQTFQSVHIFILPFAFVSIEY